MKKVSGNRKFKFENQAETPLDLFRLYSRELKSREILAGRDSFSFQCETLALRWESEQESPYIKETLIITQRWPDGNLEEITYTAEIEDPVKYQAREKAFLAEIFEGDPELLQGINRSQEEEHKEPFPDAGAFLDQLEIVQLPSCLLTYQTSHIGRGLQSLALLKLPTTPNNRADSVFSTVIERMLADPEVEKELSRRLGKFNRKGQIKFLQTGKLNCSSSFQTTLEDTAPPYVLGYRILDLCRIYINKAR